MSSSNNNEARTQAGPPTQQRTRWTKQMNIDIVRCYFVAVKETPNTHRKGMYDIWKASYNNTTFTEQRICDQKRIIFQKAENALNQTLRGNWLTQTEIEAIRNEIYADTEEDEEEEENLIPPDIQDALVEQQQAEQLPETNNETRDQNHDQNQEITEKLWGNFANAKLTNFYDRKRLCKPSKKFKMKLERATVKVNNIIDVMALQCNDITDINHLAYAAAVTSIEIA